MKRFKIRKLFNEKDRKYLPEQHTFLVCAYKESPYLEQCIKSLLAQTKKSNIIISTSTPCNYIQEIAKKYNIEVLINIEKKGIAGDWNFGYQQVGTPLVTLAHQDDIYRKNYLEKVLFQLNHSKKPLIVFTDYGEVRNLKKESNNMLLKLKRILLFPLSIQIFWRSKFVRRRILSFGNSICCPSVTYVKDNLPQTIFTGEFESNLDWQAWEKLSKLKGEFIYCKELLMYHRIHKDSTTSKIIANNKRVEEDYNMFCKFWPRWIAKGINFVYTLSEHSNQLN
ncbi:MAG: glycosyltransferase family A protein [Lachnospiraceae bacterium]|nr:glycosyltransferase family A protein [Lachnospiraceae bacterium]